MKLSKRAKEGLLCLGVFLIIVIGIFFKISYSLPNETVQTEDFTYLSDIPYDATKSSVGWGNITLNGNLDSSKNKGLITLIVDGKPKMFLKGISAHATSTVIYDISNYDYDYFSTYYGVDASRGTAGNGVKFAIYTSVDGKEWELHTLTSPPIKKGNTEAEFIKINIKGKKYIKLYAHNNGNADSDHAVYANAKLTKADYVENTEDTPVSFIKTVEEYTEMIKSEYREETDITGELEQNILKRELVKNVGYDILQAYAQLDDNSLKFLDWLMSNPKALRYYILGGKPSGSYYNSLTEYARLYRNYKEDFENTTVTEYGTVLGDLYLRMATSLSLTHSTTVGLWMSSGTPENKSDSVRRYAIMKYMHTNKLFTGVDGVNYNSWFEDYTIEEMRYVMMNNIDDESILWFNAYTQELIDKEGGARFWPHRYISYVWPNYANPIYYAEENIEYFNELFSVKKSDLNSGKELLDANGRPTGRIGMWDVTYTVPGGKDVKEYTLKITRGTNDAKVYKVWMNLRNKFGTGAVCGGISKTGSNIRGVHGLPDAVVGQPGHAAHINYFQNDKGEGFWGIDNDVSGWAYTGPGGRSLLGWGNAVYASGYSGTYIPLAQEVVNHNDTYEQSQKLVYLADSYTDLAKREEIYRKALEIQPLHLDAWYGLIQTYNASSNKSEEAYYELAKDIAENLKYYPLPMYQMTNLIKPKLTSIEESYKFTLLQTRILKEGSAIPNTSTEVLQPGITKLMANFLLGQMDTSIATFSFDGEDAGKIVLSSRFDGNGVRWDYSLDGKKTWKEVSFSAEEAHKLQLTKKEIESITSENDIYVHIVGVNYAEENLYKIDINESLGLPATMFASDLENKLLGATPSLEWKYNESDQWTRYGSKQPELTGDKSIIVRMGATGTYLASTTSSTYTFTKDIVNEERKYIPISHLAVEAFSTEAANQQGSATNAIDANYNTRWHSAWNGSDTERYLTVKLDQPYHISAVEFVPAGGGNGKIYDGTIYGSMDGENWMVLSQKKNLTYTNQANSNIDAMINIKSFDILQPQKVQYVKIVADRTNGNWFTARAFHFYEDTTMNQIPTAEINYSTKEQTEGPVTVKLVNPSANITVTNNNGKVSYTFTENGSFTFEFMDEKGRKGTAIAKVDWIVKKELPAEKPDEPPVPIVPEPSIPEKPTNSNKSPILVPNTIKPVTKILEEVSQNIVTNKKTYTNDKVTITLPSGIVEDDAKVKVENLTLSETLQEEIGKNCENDYFEIYFERKSGQRHELDNTVMEITIQIDPTKKLLNVYKLNNNGTLKNMSYKKISENKIKIITTDLGKYILSYEKENSKKMIVQKEKQDKIKQENVLNEKTKTMRASLIVIVSIVIVTLVGVIALTLIKRRKEEIEVI